MSDKQMLHGCAVEHLCLDAGGVLGWGVFERGGTFPRGDSGGRGSRAIYVVMFTLHTSINWHSHLQPIDVVAIIYKAPNQHAPTTTDPSMTLFFLDTGASVHISNNKSDFYHLCPVAPHTVHGVRGSAVQTIGIGSACIVIAKGIHIILDNVLFIPGAIVHLISVLVLTLSLKYVAHFTDSDCWVTSVSGVHVLSGTLTAHCLYVVSGGQFTAAHAFTATCSPTLETGHNCLSHANYCSIADLAHQNLATNMLISSSSPPPSCEHYMLGTQTCSSVPKIRGAECEWTGN